MTFQKKLIIYTEKEILNINLLFSSGEIRVFDTSNHKLFSAIPELAMVNNIYSQLADMHLYNYPPMFVSVVTNYRDEELTALLLSKDIFILVKIDEENQLDLLQSIDNELYRLYQSLSDIWNANNELSYSIDLTLRQKALDAHMRITKLLDRANDDINIIALDIYRIFKEKYLIKENLLPEVY